LNTMWLIAGILAWAGAALHAIGGEKMIFPGVDTRGLPSTRFGGPATSRRLLRTTWHLTSAAFTVLGAVLLVCAAIGATDATRGAARAAGASFSAFALLVIISALLQGPRALFRHPAPLALTAVAILAWWGAA
jgi:hypothetical protein